MVSTMEQMHGQQLNAQPGTKKAHQYHLPAGPIPPPQPGESPFSLLQVTRYATIVPCLYVCVVKDLQCVNRTRYEHNHDHVHTSDIVDVDLHRLRQGICCQHQFSAGRGLTSTVRSKSSPAPHGTCFQHQFSAWRDRRRPTFSMY